MSRNYAFPLERPMPRGMVSLCHGPEFYGSTQVQQFRRRWVAWVATAGIRVSEWTPGMVLDDTNGAANDLFTSGERPTKISLSFEQDALYALAIQKDATNIRLRRNVSGSVVTYDWAGLSPVLFYNGTVDEDTATTDLVCFYLKADGDAIFARLQRNNFSVEYTINSGLPIALGELTRTDYLRIGGVLFQLMWARGKDGRQVFLRSQAYPPFSMFEEDRMTMDTTLAPGLNFDTVALGAAGDAMALDAALAGGSHTDAMVLGFAQADRLGINTTLGQSSNVITVLERRDVTDSMATDAFLQSGSWAITVVTAGTLTDRMTMDTTLTAGSYA